MTEQEVLDFANINGYNLISKIQQEENEINKILSEQSDIQLETIYENIMLEYSKTIVKNIILDYSNSLNEETKMKLEKFINSNDCIEFLDKESFPKTSKSGKNPSAFAHNEKGTVVFPKYDNSEDIIKFIRKQKQVLIHETFHIVTKNNLEKEINSKYNIEYKKGMLFNEALVEKSARDFATKHNFLYHPVVSYIPYVRSLETFMQMYNISDNSQMFNIDFDKIIGIASQEQINKYYELEDADIRKKLNIEERETGKIELTPELSEIFASIDRDSKLSSSELAKFYLGMSEYQQMFKNMEVQSNQIKAQLQQLKLQNPQMSASDFFKVVMNNHSKSIIETIKKDYGDELTPEIIERLDNFNISIINNPEVRGDMTAHPEKFQVEINEAHFATDVKDIESKIVRAMGTMPHEIFHFIYRILKDENHCDERMVYNLSNGEQATCLGMTGHMLNEGFVEKLSTDFCKRNNIYSTISPTYIQFTKLCDYIMKTNSEVNKSFLIKNNYEGILNKFSPEAKVKYKETERIEYLRNFKLKTTLGEKRKIDDHEVLSSYNESVKPKYMEQQQSTQVSNKQQLVQQEKPKPFAQRSQSEIQIHQQIKEKNQIIKQQKIQQQLNKPKVKTLTQNANNSGASNKGFTNVITLSLIVSFVSGALFMVFYMLIRG